MEYCGRGTLKEMAKVGLPEHNIQVYTQEILLAVNYLYTWQKYRYMHIYTSDVTVILVFYLVSYVYVPVHVSPTSKKFALMNMNQFRGRGQWLVEIFSFNFNLRLYRMNFVCLFLSVYLSFCLSLFLSVGVCSVRTKTTFYQIWPIHWVKNEVHFITKIYHPLSTLTLTLIACILTFGQTGHQTYITKVKPIHVCSFPGNFGFFQHQRHFFLHSAFLADKYFKCN